MFLRGITSASTWSISVSLQLKMASLNERLSIAVGLGVGTQKTVLAERWSN